MRRFSATRAISSAGGTAIAHNAALSDERIVPVTPLPARADLPLVSVFVPCFNYAHFIPHCLTSVLTQDYVNLDVYVVDDGSTDNSAEVAEVFAAADPRVRVIRRPVNEGHMAAFNHGLAEARGDYVIKLDADDLLTPGSVARSVALFESHPDVGLVYGGRVLFSGGAYRSPARQTPTAWAIWPGQAWLRRVYLLSYNLIAQPEAIMRVETVRAAGPWNPELPHTFDMDMWLRLALLSDVGKIEGADQGYYRIHAGSMQHTLNSGVLRDLEGRLRALRSVLAGPGRDLPDGAELLSAACRALAVEALRHACDVLGGPAGRRPDDESFFARRATDRDSGAAFIAFAQETYPGARELRAWATADGLRRGDPRALARHRARTAVRGAYRQAKAHIRLPEPIGRETAP